MKPRKSSKNADNRRSASRGLLRRALLPVAGVAAVCVGLYGAAVVYGAPWLIDRALQRYREAAPGRSASRDTIRFDPFTLVGEITRLETIDADTGTRFAADRLVVDFAARSLIEFRPVISAVVVERPRIELASTADLTGFARQARDGLPGGTNVERLAVTDGALAIGAGADRAFATETFSLTLTGLDARGEDAGEFALDALTATGTTIAARGSLAANLERADGRLDLDAIELDAVAPRLGGMIGSTEPRGRVDLSARFAATQLLGAPALALSDATVDFSDLSLSPTADLTVTASGSATATDLLLASGDDDGPAISGRIEADAAQVSIRDAHVTPPQSFAFDDAAVLASVDDAGLSLILGGRIRQAGSATLTVRVPPGAAPRRVSLEAAELPAQLLSAYAVDSLGRGLTAGTAGLSLDFALTDGRGDGSLRFRARNLAFAESAADDRAAGGPSLELAAALLEDAAGIIDLDLRFAIGTGAVYDALADALSARISAVTETPFDTLATLIDGTSQPASALPFLPGDAALGDRALASVDALAEALSARPRLGVRVYGGYDATADRDALARQQIELHVALATAGATEQARPAPVDFGSPRAQDVLDEFAGERLPAERVATLSDRFSCEGALADVCRRVYYERVFDALVANEEIRPATLSRLGRFRAQSIADALQQRGIPAERIELVTGNNAVETPFGIGLPVELTAQDSAP